jgi:hypothetical protein
LFLGMQQFQFLELTVIDLELELELELIGIDHCRIINFAHIYIN